LRAPGDPLHRPAQPARRPGDERLLGVVLALEAEAPADVGRDDAQACLVETELLAHVLADVVRRLGAAIERAAGRVPERNGASPLERRAAQAIVHEIDADHARRPGERGVGRRPVAALPFEADFAY